MDTSIGAGLRNSRPRAWVAASLGVAVLLADALCVLHVDYYAFSSWRIGLGAGCLVVLALLSWSPASVGLTHRASPSWGYWPRWLGVWLLVLLALLLVFGILVWTGVIEFELKPAYRSRRALLAHLPNMCLHAPLSEELLYRVAVCVPCVALLGARWTVVVSGVAFAALHWVYGNPFWDNQIAGFLLGYAYLRSGSVVVPVVLHAGGNFVVFLVNYLVFLFQT